MAKEPQLHDGTGGYRNAPTTPPGTPSAPGAPPPDTVTFSGVLMVDSDELRRAVAAFGLASADAASAAAVAQGQTGAGAPGVPEWGSDPLGQAFGSSYTPVASEVATALQEVAQLFASTSGQLMTAVTAFAATEQANDELVSGR
jgi:hypothetical protein